MAHPFSFPGAKRHNRDAAKRQNDLQHDHDKDEVNTFLLCSCLIFPNCLPRELSNGFFPANNQKRLTGSSTDIPIYEAKVSDPKDLRIVVTVELFLQRIHHQLISQYNIDCTPDYSDSV